MNPEYVPSKLQELRYEEGSSKPNVTKKKLNVESGKIVGQLIDNGTGEDDPRSSVKKKGPTASRQQVSSTKSVESEEEEFHFEAKAAFILHGMATAAVTSQTELGKTDVKYDWLHVRCTEIRLVTAAMTKHKCGFTLSKHINCQQSTIP
uniref:Uncharacterized protein n=1 Tax=Romanomermis culicivorax TaxID=13658 RepID=A0A915KT10_ROMCU